LTGSVVGAGRDHPKSLSSPTTGGLRRSFAEASDLRFVASVPFPFPRLPGSMNSVPLRPAIIPPEGFLITFGPSDA
jgi:hypothetical protein